MEQRPINPWTWQDQFGFSQAIEVKGAERVLVCAGQTSGDADGQVLHAEDMRAQALQALANLEAVLGEAGLGLENVVRLNHYTLDVDRYLAEAWPAVAERLGQAGVRPASTLLGVTRLARPELLLEIEATAVA